MVAPNSTPPEPPSLPDYAALIWWLDAVIEYYQAQITVPDIALDQQNRTSQDVLLADLRAELEEVRRLRSLIDGNDTRSSQSDLVHAVRKIIVQGLCTWKSPVSASRDEVPPLLTATFVATMLLPLVVTPLNKLPPFWQEGLKQVAGPRLGQLIWSMHIAYTMHKYSSLDDAFGELIESLAKPIYQDNIIALLSDLQNPNAGGKVVASTYRALACGKQRPFPGFNLLSALYTALGAAAGAAITGLIGNRFDAIVVQAWEDFWNMNTSLQSQVDDLVGEAKIHYYAARYELAIDKATEAIRLDSTSAKAFCVRGDSYLNLSQNKSAIIDLNEALRLDPDLAWAWRARADYFLVTGSYEQAVNDSTEALHLDPESARSLHIRAECYRRLGKCSQGVEDATAVLRLEPQSAKALRNRAECYRILGKYSQGVEDATAALRLEPQSAMALLNRAECYRMLGRHSLAMEDATAALRVDAYSVDSAIAYEVLGAMYYERRNYRKAQDFFSKAIRLNPKSSFSIDYLQRIRKKA